MVQRGRVDWRGWWAIVAVCLSLFGPSPSVWADGLLPPLQYHYLHPPSNLTRANEPPLSVIRSLPSDYMRAVSWLAVTPDRQAEVSAPRNAFAVSPHTDGVVVRIDPVDPPAALPAGMQVDGNAYRVTAAQDPGNRPARPVRVLTVTLAWPHRPLAIYLYSSGRWTRLCSIGQSHAGEGLISCRTPALGVFAAVRSAASPVSSGTSLLPYAVALGAICALLIVAVLVVRRSSRVARG